MHKSLQNVLGFGSGGQMNFYDPRSRIISQSIQIGARIWIPTQVRNSYDSTPLLNHSGECPYLMVYGIFLLAFLMSWSTILEGLLPTLPDNLCS